MATYKSFSIRTRSTPIDDNEDLVHGVNCYNVSNPSTLPPSNEKISIFSSIEKDKQIPEFTTTVEIPLTTQYTESVYDSTSEENTRNEQNVPTATPLPNMLNTQILTDTTPTDTIKHLVIVLCVLVALNVGVMLFKIIRNRKTTSRETDYNCAYNKTEIGHRIPNVVENQYETVRLTDKECQ